MKSVELFCASPASTAICSSMDQRSMVRHGTKQIERQSHRLGGYREKSRAQAPCSSQIPISPRPYFEKSRKSTTSSAKPSELLHRKSSADISDLSSPAPSSSRYLLSDNPIFDFISDSEHSTALVPSKSLRNKLLNLEDDFPVFRSSSSRSYESPVYQSSLVRPNNLHAYKSPLSRSNDSNAKKSSPTCTKELIAYKSSPIWTKDSHAYKSSTTRARHQVVELRVSIHCKGCEGKIRKHISRMEGVTSFSIDLATKKVTIVGNVTPLAVLSSVSKVKYAEFWPSPTSSSSASSPRVGYD